MTALLLLMFSRYNVYSEWCYFLQIFSQNQSVTQSLVTPANFSHNMLLVLPLCVLSVLNGAFYCLLIQLLICRREKVFLLLKVTKSHFNQSYQSLCVPCVNTALLDFRIKMQRCDVKLFSINRRAMNCIQTQAQKHRS